MDADPSAHEYDVLLPGEAASIVSHDRKDIEHWITVYSELCAFKERLLETLVQQRQNVGPDGRLEVDHDDILFRREYQRLHRRLQYWKGEKGKPKESAKAE